MREFLIAMCFVTFVGCRSFPSKVTQEQDFTKIGGAYTANYNLYKPASGDTDYVDPFADGMDVIDSELDTLNTSTQALAASVAILDTSTQSIAASVATLDTSTQSLAASVATLDTSTQSIAASVATLDTSTQALASSVATLDTSTQTLQTQLDTVATDTTTIASNLSSTASALSALTSEVATDTTTIASNLSSTAAALSALTSAVATDTTTIAGNLSSTATALSDLTSAVATDTTTIAGNVDANTTAISTTGVQVAQVATDTTTIAGNVATNTSQLTQVAIDTTTIYANTIHLTSTLQSGATFFVSSGSVSGELHADEFHGDGSNITNLPAVSTATVTCDNDQDTCFQTEKAADDDTLRLETVNIERMVISSQGVVSFPSVEMHNSSTTVIGPFNTTQTSAIICAPKSTVTITTAGNSRLFISVIVSLRSSVPAIVYATIKIDNVAQPQYAYARPYSSDATSWENLSHSFLSDTLSAGSHSVCLATWGASGTTYMSTNATRLSVLEIK